MATSVVEICNLALAELGEELITDLSDGTTQANLCSAHYEQARDYVLADYPWTFALARKVPAQLASHDNWEWTYAYQIPTDSLRVLRTDLDDMDPPGLWVQEGDRIYTNESSIKLHYITTVSSVVKFSAHFTVALSKYLAAQLAYPLTNSRALQQAKLSEYMAAKEDAAEVDAQIGNGLFRTLEATTLTRIRR